MPKIKRQRRRQKFDYSKNRRKLNIKLKQKKQPKILEDTVKREWDNNKSNRYNMESMGLSFDSNNAIAKGYGNKAGAVSRQQVPLANKIAVRKELEEKAAIPESVKLSLSTPDTQYVIYMLDRYGEDYKAMARDRRNYYQDTPKQIRKKIMTFQKIPELYEAYLMMKEDGTLSSLG